MWLTADAKFEEIAPIWIEAVATVVGVIVALIAIVLTLKQVRMTAQQMRQASEREAQDSEDQTRPYVGLDVLPGLGGAPSFDMVIENFGKATAYDVRLRLVNEEFGPQSESDEIGSALGRLFAVGFDLAPGARRRVFWRLPADENASPSGAMGAPEAAEVVVEYGWEPGGDRESRVFKDRLRYDLSEYPKLTPSPTKGARTIGSTTDAQLKNAVHALGAIAEHVAEIRR
ncbi:hypothetical protein [Agromyces subbeticus]|uniref:hypothetical protein n=1 Tax=Agromyces subbeticus TaxID=293890 RepID=UPI0003B67584|nr:hypothetical protein [Agromyces subbeticus]